MSDDITIPPEAFTAAELAYTEALSNGEDPIRAACLAMLKHWPGGEVEGRYFMFRGADSRIILPLPTETSE